MCSVKEYLQIQNYPEAVLAASHANNVPCILLFHLLLVFKVFTSFLYQIEDASYFV